MNGITTPSGDAGGAMRPIASPNKKLELAVDAGPAPMLQWIAIEKLAIDDRYQRDLKPGNWKSIRRIAEQFKWSRFSPVFVAPVEGGRFAIIDGQHRTHAAALCGFAEVPCQVVQMTLEEQAASFAAVNGFVTKVGLHQIFKAALAAGDEWAVACAGICAAANCRLMTYLVSTEARRAGEIHAIALIRGYHAKGQGELVTFTLAALRASEGGAEPTMWGNDVLKSLISAVVDRPWLMAQRVDLAAFLDGFDIYAAIDRAEDLARQKRRQGHIGISRWDIAAAEIGEGLDRAFPQRIALPKSKG